MYSFCVIGHLFLTKFKFNQVYDKTAHYNSYRDKAAEIINAIMRNEPIEMDRKATDISGNLDADKIRQICSDHGITYTIDSACRGGVALEDVKNKRNQLAHGTTSFAECGRYYAIDDLEKIKNETVIFFHIFLICHPLLKTQPSCISLSKHSPLISSKSQI